VDSEQISPSGRQLHCPLAQYPVQHCEPLAHDAPESRQRSAHLRRTPPLPSEPARWQKPEQHWLLLSQI